MDRNINPGALQQTIAGQQVRFLKDPIGIVFADGEAETQTAGGPATSLTLVRDEGAGSFRLELNDPSNSCAGQHVAQLDLSDLHLRVRFKPDALIRSGSVGEPGRQLLTELIVKLDLSPQKLKTCLGAIEKIARGACRVRYVGLTLRSGDPQDTRRS